MSTSARFDRFIGVPYDWSASTVYVSLHTGPPPPLPNYWMRADGSMIEVVSGTEYTRADPDCLGPDATPTGIGDPLADVLRNIDELIPQAD